VPLFIRNPVTSLMKELGYGEGYRFPHRPAVSPQSSDASEKKAEAESGKQEAGREDTLGGFIATNYLPEKLAGKRFYFPKEEGAEKKVRDLLERRWGKEMRRKGSGRGDDTK